jgi:hypothetical protein
MDFPSLKSTDGGTRALSRGDEEVVFGNYRMDGLNRQWSSDWKARSRTRCSLLGVEGRSHPGSSVDQR